MFPRFTIATPSTLAIATVLHFIRIDMYMYCTKLAVTEFQWKLATPFVRESSTWAET